ncbi:MAG: L-2-amino-thiazoline-4-carboxylic acid hydrolase [Tissierellia bacterium]|nr:L-2-amino-thiazoline-4-carboxylic acid hydrolase [Tissierellia bacterium]
MEITNKKSKTNPALDGQRNICQRRAATISNMIEEAKKLGVDKDFARRAIYKYGEDIAVEMKEKLEEDFDNDEFLEVFASQPHYDIYEMEVVDKTDDRFEIHFNYCPYVEEWIKQGYSGDDLAELCDITMEGDRAIGDSFKELKFTLGKTIAEGNCVCELLFERKKED